MAGLYAVKEPGHTAPMSGDGAEKKIQQAKWKTVPCRVCDEPVVDVRRGLWICSSCWRPFPGVLPWRRLSLEEVEDLSHLAVLDDGEDPFIGD